jgi:hypothetical protein
MWTAMVPSTWMSVPVPESWPVLTKLACELLSSNSTHDWE